MPAPAIKICGLTSAEALEATIAARADYAGLVFFAPSPRHLALDAAAALSAQAAGRIGRVGLFVDADDATIAATLAAVPLDALQLHGDEAPERAAQLRSRFGIPVWKALPVSGPDDIAAAHAYAGAADLILFDAKTPRGALPGGMGLTFDWSLLSRWKAMLPWGLAGGLDPENVAEAVRIAAPPLVDASSGVESTPGIKDPAKIAAFCATARAT